MNDTSPEIAAKLNQLFMQRPGYERMLMGFEMFSLARTIVRSSLEAQGYQGVALKQHIFLRTYGEDFSAEQREKICQALIGSTEPSSPRKPGLLKGELGSTFFEPLPEDEQKSWES